MLPTDLPLVMAIEQAAHPYPWTEGMMQSCLKAGYGFHVLEQAELLGFCVFSVVTDEWHLLNLCIAPAYQGQGLGRFLLCQLLEQARVSGAMTAFLEVRPSNQAARALYQGVGFCEVGYRKGYYPGGLKGREDALVMAMDLGVWHNPCQ
jgi:ribosomal-protein-alanine N-acetyltransferase